MQPIDRPLVLRSPSRETATKPPIPSTSTQPPQQQGPKRPHKPHVKASPGLPALDPKYLKGLTNQEFVERLHLREFITRYASLLFPGMQDLRKASSSGRTRPRRSAIPQWLKAATDSPLNGFWSDEKNTLSLLLAILTCFKSEMQDAKIKLQHGQPLLETGKPQFDLFNELLDRLDEFDFDSVSDLHSGVSRFWIAAHHLLVKEGLLSTPLSHAKATDEEQQALVSSDEQTSSDEDEEDEASDDDGPARPRAEDGDGNYPAAQETQEKSDIESEPSTSEDEEKGPFGNLQDTHASAKKAKVVQSDEEDFISSEEEMDEDDTTTEPKGRRSTRISTLQHEKEEQKTATAHAEKVSRLRHRQQRVTRATAQLDFASVSPPAAPKPREKKKKTKSPRRHLLDWFSPSRRISDKERVVIINGFFDLMVCRSDDFRQTLDEVSRRKLVPFFTSLIALQGLEIQKTAKQATRKVNADFTHSKSDHQKARPAEAQGLPKWTRQGEDMLARYEETVAQLYPETRLSSLRFSLISAFDYLVYIPVPLTKATCGRPPSQTSSISDTVVSSWTVLVHGREPPTSWLTWNSSLTHTTENALALPTNRRQWFSLSDPEQVRSFIQVLDGHLKLRLWERKDAAFEREHLGGITKMRQELSAEEERWVKETSTIDSLASPICD